MAGDIRPVSCHVAGSGPLPNLKKASKISPKEEKNLLPLLTVLECELLTLQYGAGNGIYEKS